MSKISKSHFINGWIMWIAFSAVTIWCHADDSLLAQLDAELKWLQEESVVWSASKFEQKSSEAPSLVSVVTADQIKKYGYRNLMEILNRLSGIYGTYNQNYHFIGVRGFGRPGDLNTRVLLLVDGHRINDNIFHQAYVGSDFPVDIDLIDRIEFARGPGSCLYGTNSFFGVINVMTKKGKAISGVESSVETGTFKSFKGRLSYGEKLSDNSEILISGTVYESPGEKNIYYKEFDDPSTNNGIAENLDGEYFEKLFLKTSWHDVTLSGVYSSREKDVPAAPYGSPFNIRFSTIDDRSFLELKYDRRFSDDTQLYSRIYYDRYVYKGYYPYEAEDIGIIYNVDNDLSEWIGGEIRLNQRFFKIDTLTLGVEYYHNHHQDLFNYDEEPYEIYIDEHKTSSVWAVYAQNELKIRDNVILNLGFRYDHYNFFGGSFNPRIALIYHPWSQTAVKLIYGSAFRGPDIYEERIVERTGEDGGLDPETIKTYEAVIEHKIKDYLQAYLSGYIYKIDGLITQTPYGDGGYTYANIDDIEAAGVEAELRCKWKNYVTASLNYTFQNVTYKETDEWLTNSPKHMVKAGVEIPLIQNKLAAAVEARYESKRKTILETEVDDAMTADAVLFSKNLIEGFELSAGVYNLFDKDIYHPGSEYHVQEIIEQQGRTFRLKATVAF